MSQVGSARHDYTKSNWYVQAEKEMKSFWSEPYYYYDGTSISDHYCTFVQPIRLMAIALLVIVLISSLIVWFVLGRYAKE